MPEAQYSHEESTVGSSASEAGQDLSYFLARLKEELGISLSPEDAERLFNSPKASEDVNSLEAIVNKLKEE